MEVGGRTAVLLVSGVVTCERVSETIFSSPSPRTLPSGSSDDEGGGGGRNRGAARDIPEGGKKWWERGGEGSSLGVSSLVFSPLVPSLVRSRGVGQSGRRLGDGCEAEAVEIAFSTEIKKGDGEVEEGGGGRVLCKFSTSLGCEGRSVREAGRSTAPNGGIGDGRFRSTVMREVWHSLSSRLSVWGVVSWDLSCRAVDWLLWVIVHCRRSGIASSSCFLSCISLAERSPRDGLLLLVWVEFVLRRVVVVMVILLRELQGLPVRCERDGPSTGMAARLGGMEKGSGEGELRCGDATVSEEDGCHASISCEDGGEVVIFRIRTRSTGEGVRQTVLGGGAAAVVAAVVVEVVLVAAGGGGVGLLVRATVRWDDVPGEAACEAEEKGNRIRSYNERFDEAYPGVQGIAVDDSGGRAVVLVSLGVWDARARFSSGEGVTTPLVRGKEGRGGRLYGGVDTHAG